MEKIRWYKKVTKSFSLKEGSLQYLLIILESEIPFLESYAREKGIKPEDDPGVYVCKSIYDTCKGLKESELELNIYEIDYLMSAIEMSHTVLETNGCENLNSLFHRTVMQLYYEIRRVHTDYNELIIEFFELDDKTKKEILVEIKKEADGYEVSI